MKLLQSIPGAAWVRRHPRLAAWIVLSVGMVAIIIYEARDVGLLATQWIALTVATVLVAGLCVYIVSWEDNSEPDAAPIASPDAEPPAPSDAQKDAG